VQLPNDTLLEFKSADDPSKLVSVGLDLLVLTECHLITDAAYRESLRPTLDSPGRYGVGLYTGLPTTMPWIEDFKRLADEGDPNYFYVNEPSWANPHLNIESLEQAKRELPKRVFDHQYGAVWPTSEGAVFRRINDSCVIECATETPPIMNATNGQVFDGLDPARLEDWMAYVALERRADGKLWQVGFDRYNRVDWNLQLQRVASIASRFPNRAGFCDSTGIGDVVIPMLRNQRTSFSDYKFTTESKEQLVNELAAALDADKLRLFNHPIIKDELRRFTYTLRSSGSYSYGAPEGHHDDVVFALALAVWAARHVHMPMDDEQRAYVLGRFGR
jgi:hypothetical protein